MAQAARDGLAQHVAGNAAYIFAHSGDDSHRSDRALQLTLAVALQYEEGTEGAPTFSAQQVSQLLRAQEAAELSVRNEILRTHAQTLRCKSAVCCFLSLFVTALLAAVLHILLC